MHKQNLKPKHHGKEKSSKKPKGNKLGKNSGDCFYSRPYFVPYIPGHRIIGTSLVPSTN